MPKELSKCREWEKERRNRLNNSFANLNKLLPNYDPSINRSKSDILQRATEYIQELQDKVKEVLEKDDKYKPLQEEIKKLYQRIKKLLTRNEQLSKLLQDAGIRVPSECGTVKKFKDRRKWSEKLTPEQAKLILEKYEAQKENKPQKVKQQRKQNGNKANKANNKSKIGKPKRSIRNGRNPAIQAGIIKSTESKKCVILSNISTTAISLSTTTVVTNTAVFSTPLVTPAVKPSSIKVTTKSSTQLNTLGPGTLILANGNIVPILPQTPILQPQTIIHPSPIIVNSSPANNTTLFIVPNNLNTSNVSNLSNSVTVSVTTVSNSINSKISTILSKNYSNIRPKTNVTKTTQINKVPIPALSSQFASNKLNKTIEKDGAKELDAAKTIETNNKKATSKRVCNSTKKIPCNKKPKLQCESTLLTETPMAVQEPSDSNKKSNKSSYSIDSLFSENNAKTETSRENDKATVEENQSVETTETTANKPDNVLKSESQNDILENCKVAAAVAVANDKLLTGTESEVQNDKVNECKESNEKNSAIEIISDTNISFLIANTAPSESTANTTTTEQDATKTNSSNDMNSSTTESQVTDTKISNEPMDKSDNITEPPSRNEADVQKAADEPSDKTASNTNSAKSLELIGDLATKERDAPKCETVPEKVHENVHHSDLSNDLFAHLQVPTGSQNPESTSPTAAFLLAFPLVSSLTGVKVTEVLEDEAADSCHETPTILQIGTMDTTKPIQTQSDSLTPNLLNLDSFTFFSSKDMCNNFYPPFDSIVSTCSTTTTASAAAACGTFKSVPQNKPRIETTAIVSVAAEYDTIKSVYSTANITSLPAKEIGTKSSHKATSATYVHSNAYNASNSQYCGLQSNASSLLNGAGNNKTVSQKPRIDYKVSCRQYSGTAKSYGTDNYNTFNPFTELPKTTTCCYDTTKSSFNEPFITSNTNYNYQSYQSDINFDVNFSQTKTTSSTLAKNDAKQSFCNYDQSYVDYKTLDIPNNLNASLYNNHAVTDDKTKNQTVKQSKSTGHNQSKGPVNWMTTPDTKQQSNDFPSAHANKEIVDFAATNPMYAPSTFVTAAPPPQSTYFGNGTATIYPDIQNNYDNNRKLDGYGGANPFNPRTDNEENRFTWSPIKLPHQLLEPPGFVPSTLPSLVGDLALGTTSQMMPFGEQKADAKHRAKEKRPKSFAYEAQTNFLSVSQLVDHDKPMHGVQNSNRVAHRRNSNNNNRAATTKATPPQKSIAASKRNQKTEHHHHQQHHKDSNNAINHNYNANVVPTKPAHLKTQYDNNQSGNNNDCWSGVKQSNRSTNASKTASSYSAEALIGNQNTSSDLTKSRHHHHHHHQSHNNFAMPSTKSLNVAPFLADNILPYFPPVDLQENNYGQTNSTVYPANGFSHNFSTTTITTTGSTSYATSTSSNFMQTPITNGCYLPSTNFLTEIASSHDYNAPPSIIATDNIFSHHSNAKANDKPYKSSSAKSLTQTHNTNHNNRSNNDDKRNLPHNALGDGFNVGNNVNVNNHASVSSYAKKSNSKRKTSSDNNNFPGFVDFGFLSVQNAISSPILPDDFHAHTNFLPPPPSSHHAPPPHTHQSQLYPCKNALYAKQNETVSGALLPLPPVPVSRNNVQLDMAPTMMMNSNNNNNIGTTSLTNFNLSTIFPEINNKSSNVQDFNTQKSYFPSSSQNHFASKSTMFTTANDHTTPSFTS